MKKILSISPIDNRLLNEYGEFNDEKINLIIDSASALQRYWKSVDWKSKSRLFITLAETLRAQKPALAELMTLEMGKPIIQSEMEVDKCAWVCEYYANHAEQFLAQKKIQTDATNSFVTFNPLGVILAIMPWNFPLWQVFRFAAPTLMAGNTALLKHASNVMGCALAIEELFTKAGFPPGIFQALIIGSEKVATVIKHPAVKGISLTGSTNAGKKVAALAGEYLKKQVLELGGSDPYLIFPDADLKKVVPLCANARLINGGQSCIAAKRFVVHEAVYDDFLEMFKYEFENKLFGDPFNRANALGPQARGDLRDELHAQVMNGLNYGAKIVTGGFVPKLEGAYYPPTILTNISQDNPLYYEELFGPAATVFKVQSLDEMIQTANDSPFGLGAAVFSEDVQLATTVAATTLDAGSCFVNTSVKSDPRLPFGGIKNSGYGRELSEFGILEFVNIKTVYVE